MYKSYTHKSCCGGLCTRSVRSVCARMKAVGTSALRGCGGCELRAACATVELISHLHTENIKYT